MKELMESLPPRLRQELRFAAREEELQEIHMRLGRRTEAVTGRSSILLEHRARREELEAVLDTAMDRSYYASQRFLREGFCTARGGCRIGITGNVVQDEAGIKTIRDISGLNIRFARAFPGIAGQALGVLREEPASMLIIGRPGCGKTTLLRDLIRRISDELCQRVAVADTRYELGAVHEGRPMLDLGQRTDVLSGGKKAESIAMLLRCMNPQWIAVDEITAEEDVRALENCHGCGVHLLATAHAWDRFDLQRRPVYRAMLHSGIFRYLAEMDGTGSYKMTELEVEDG
ncbi:MAG: stage III sporulation protein AB [Oscillospiraceae bacterium]|nr:stage III sporulation protein AB [Oscillospiraceae bacterium]